MAPKRSRAAARITAITTTGSQKKRSKRTLSDVKTLGQQLLSSQAFFATQFSSLPSSSSTHGAATSAASDPEVIYRTWLRSKFDEFVNSLIDVAVSSLCEDAIRDAVLETLMVFVKSGNGGKFYSALYHKLVQAIVNSSLEVEFVLETLASSYFKFIDVRYFTYISVEKLCKTLESNNSSGDKGVCKEGDDLEASLDYRFCLCMSSFRLSQTLCASNSITDP